MNTDWIKAVPRWALYVLAAFILFLVISVIGLSCDNTRLQDERTAAQNAAAKADRLKTIAENETTVLRERFAISDKELDHSILQNELLTNNLKAQDARVLSLTKIATEFRLENERLRGKKGEDSVGVFADFDTLTTEYQLSLRARIEPTPILDIKSIFFIDSTYIAHYETKDGMLHGVIANKNKNVLNYGAEFFVQLSHSEASPVLSSVYWTVGIILIVGSFLLGLAL